MPDHSDSDLQRQHYNAILDDYDAHYGDAASMEYRRRFFLSPLLGDLDLNNMDVADLAAGSGHTTLQLLARFPEARPIGFDVSEDAVRAYIQRTGRHAQVWDLTGAAVPDRNFDVAVVVGGLHHCVNSLEAVLSNVARVVRPGGHFLMVEPSSDTWLELARKRWYRRDRYFEESSEGALSHDRLREIGSRWFEPLYVRHMGGPAYFLVYNSLVFRVPHAVKPFIAPPLMTLERFFNAVPLKAMFPYFIARWRRHPDR